MNGRPDSMKKSSNAYFIAILVSLGLVLTMVYNAHARSKPGIYINFPIVMLENKSYRDGENLRSLKKTGYLLCL
jgi:hypothetical protein